MKVARGAQVDALWSSRIGNLGEVKYVFEVQDGGGSVDSLLLNLQRAQADPIVQKLVVVANTKMLTKVKDEADPLPEAFRKAMAYWEAKDVLEAYDLQKRFYDILDSLELVKTRF